MSKVDLPASTERERERAPKAPHEQHAYTLRGASNGSHMRRSCRHGGWSNEGMVAVVFRSRLRLGVEELSPWRVVERRHGGSGFPFPIEARRRHAPFILLFFTYIHLLLSHHVKIFSIYFSLMGFKP